MPTQAITHHMHVGARGQESLHRVRVPLLASPVQWGVSASVEAGDGRIEPKATAGREGRYYTSGRAISCHQWPPCNDCGLPVRFPLRKTQSTSTATNHPKRCTSSLNLRVEGAGNLCRGRPHPYGSRLSMLAPSFRSPTTAVMSSCFAAECRSISCKPPPATTPPPPGKPTDMLGEVQQTPGGVARRQQGRRRPLLYRSSARVSCGQNLSARLMRRPRKLWGLG